MSDLKESSLFSNLNEQVQHWYYSTKISLIHLLLDEYLPVPTRKIKSASKRLECLDIGAGNGIMGYSVASFLSDKGQLSSWDLVDSGYDLSTSLNASCEPHFSPNYLNKPPANKDYDLVLGIDVLEHINDDYQFLQSLQSNACAGAIAIFTVPALEYLWSDHDLYLEHYRRYTRKRLTKACSRLNVEILDSGYIFSLTLFPLTIYIYLKKLAQIVLNRRHRPSSNMQHLNIGINLLLRYLLSLELYIKHAFPILKAIPGSTAYVVIRFN